MTTPQSQIPVTARVSILERLVPAFAFGLAAISGAVGSALLLRFLSVMRQAESAGYAAFFGGMAEVEFAVGAVLAFSAVVCGIAILVSIIRMFTTNATSSPSGLLLLGLGLFSLISPFALHYIMHVMKETVVNPIPGSAGISGIVSTINAATYFSIGFAVLMIVVLLAFSFIPFSSRTGRKVSPLVCLILVEIMIVGLAGIYFWQGRGSLIERDKDRPAVEHYSTPTESPETNSSYVPLPNQVDDILEGVDGATNDNSASAADSRNNVSSNSNGRTIAGGVLNGKAVKLPQPAYPPAARAIRASGAVSVQVLVDEKGEVVSATAISGHALLRAAAVEAARQARFAPTMLSGKPVSVSGVLTYNFTME